MTDALRRDSYQRRDAQLLIGAGAIALFGSVCLLAGNIIGSIVVPNHDWVADTVSDLAAGRYEIIQDVALYGYAAALIACALGAAHFHAHTKRWNAGILCLAILAVCVVVIGARNEYGDNDNEGIVIHIYLVYALGVFFTLLFVAMAKGMGVVNAVYARISYGCAALWGVGAPIFFILPTSFDGAFERGLGVITMVWVCAFGVMLIQVACRDPKPIDYPE